MNGKTPLAIALKGQGVARFAGDSGLRLPTRFRLFILTWPQSGIQRKMVPLRQTRWWPVPAESFGGNVATEQIMNGKQSCIVAPMVAVAAHSAWQESFSHQLALSSLPRPCSGMASHQERLLTPARIVTGSEKLVWVEMSQGTRPRMANKPKQPNKPIHEERLSIL